MTNKTLPRMNTDGMDNQPKSKANPLKRGGTEDAEELRTGRKPKAKAKSQKPKAKSQKPKAKSQKPKAKSQRSIEEVSEREPNKKAWIIFYPG